MQASGANPSDVRSFGIPIVRDGSEFEIGRPRPMPLRTEPKSLEWEPGETKIGFYYELSDDPRPDATPLFRGGGRDVLGVSIELFGKDTARKAIAPPGPVTFLLPVPRAALERARWLRIHSLDMASAFRLDPLEPVLNAQLPEDFFSGRGDS